MKHYNVLCDKGYTAKNLQYDRYADIYIHTYVDVYMYRYM